MAIKVANLFGELGLEATQRQILRAVQYARDINDRLRVVVDNQPPVVVYNQNTSTVQNGNATQAPYSASSWNLIDQREIVRQQSELAFMQSRSRWTIT